jgi:hypothetical protein
MQKKNLVNLLLVAAAVSLVAAFAFSVRLEAADRVAILKGEGITADGAARIVRALEGEQGVASVAVDNSSGRVIVGYDSWAVAPETLAKRVAAAGYGCRLLQIQTFEEYRNTPGAIPLRPSRRCCCEPESKS